jgi:hypothetical protein
MSLGVSSAIRSLSEIASRFKSFHTYNLQHALTQSWDVHLMCYTISKCISWCCSSVLVVDYVTLCSTT